MGWTGALTPAMHRIRPPPASQGEWDEISTLARPHSAKLAVRRNAGCDRIAQDSLVLLVEYEDPHDPGSHTPASLDTINSALQSQAIALLQALFITLVGM